MKHRRTTVLVLMGGPDAEREVSIDSGTEVARALRECGRFDVREEVIHRPDLSGLRLLGGDVIFPVLHGQWGEGGPLQQLLEALGRPYVGCGPDAAFLAMDKMKSKALLERHGVYTPAAQELAAVDHCTIDPPLVLKPVDDGSSVDIRICHTADEVSRGRAELHPHRPRIMAEAYIPGRELTVGIVNGEALPIIEILPSAPFYDYEAKYRRDDTRYQVNPALPGPVARQAREQSLLAWNLIGCRDVARVDYRLDDRDRLWFLEINTMPGFTTHSLVPMAARAMGTQMPALCASLVDAALARCCTGVAMAGTRSPSALQGIA